jgi:hypothetical protein
MTNLHAFLRPFRVQRGKRSPEKGKKYYRETETHILFLVQFFSVNYGFGGN